MIRWGNEDVLYLLLIIPVLAIFFYFTKGRAADRLRANFASSSLLTIIAPNLSIARKRIKDALIITATALLIIALADPQIGTHIEEVKREGIDLVIAIDVSTSMLAQDIAPSRLEKAKHEMRRLLSKLRGDRVALVAFSGAAVIECPLTLDYGAAELFLDVLEPGLVSKPGTSLSAAIKTSLMAFQETSPAGKAIVLITDGEDHLARVTEAAEEAKQRGVIIHTIGIGTPQGVPIPMGERGGEFKKDDQGNVVVTRLDEATLEQIASLTGGVYQRCTSSGEPMDAVIGAISGLEKGELGSKKFTQYEHRYQPFVLLALILLIIEFWLSDRRMKMPAFLQAIRTEGGR